jgi:hypothetical protein
MPYTDVRNTIDAITALIQKEGGDLHFQDKASIYTFSDWVTANSIPADFIPFSISLYDIELNSDLISLTMMINPKDILYGQSHVFNNSYTREGWVTSLWGNQQLTITGSGVTAGFYYSTQTAQGGLTNFYRKNSISFLNLLSIVSFFKNNGYYFMDGEENPTIFKDGTSRVINVMDIIRVSYDGSDYLGSFNSFTLIDDALSPYKMEYNFEFVVSSFGTDLQGIEGHVKRNGNETSNTITVAIQGKNTNLNTVIGMDATELNAYFPPEPEPDVEQYIRGGAEQSTKQNTNNVSKFRKVDVEKFLRDNPSVDAKLAQVAGRMGVTKEDLAAIIHFESDGTWATTVNNPYSSALGIGQWTNAAAQNMADTLSKPPYNLIDDPSKIKTSADLVSYADTVEKQIELFYVYASTTSVPGGQTLLESMNSKNSSKERFETYMIGHFQPAYVGKPLDTEFSSKVRSVNPGVNTPQDYINKVNERLKKITSQKPTVASSGT